MEKTHQASRELVLGGRLKRLRLERGLTQGDLAHPRYSHAYISTIESGRRTPSPKALEFFAQKLRVDIDELATGRPKGLATQLRLQLENARADLSHGQLEKARQEALSVIKRAREFELPRVEARAHEIEALAMEQGGELEDAINMYERAIELLRNDAPTGWAYAIAGKVRCLNAQGDPHHAVFVGEQYLEHLKRKRMASPSSVLRVRSSLLLAYFAAGSRTKARDAADECQRLIPKVNDPSTLAATYVNVGAVQLSEGHHADADIALAKAEELYEALDLTNEAGIALLARGYSLARDGKLKQARRALERASSTLSGTRNIAEHANAEMELARLDRLEGDSGRAVDRLMKSLEYVGAGKQPRLEAWAHRELGLALHERDKAAAEKHLRKALELYELQGVQVEVARTYVLMAELQSAGDKGRQLEAYKLAASAIGKIPEM